MSFPPAKIEYQQIYDLAHLLIRYWGPKRIISGYAGRILRIDLTRQKFSFESLDQQMAKDYIGGKGFGVKMLFDELPKGTDPLGPENKLIFTVGPFTATPIPTSSRYGVFFKSPLTGFLGESYSGGSYAPEIKKAGYDAIIIQGRAQGPTYIHINDDDVLFKDATHLWGLDTHVTEDAIKQEIGSKKVKVATIGPAGERLVRFACICNDYWRQAGRCGGGAVMGSKNVKAIAIEGSKKIEMANEEGLRAMVLDLLKKIPKDLPLSRNGTLGRVDQQNALGTFPTRYWHEGVSDFYKEFNASAMREKIWIRNKGCYNCTLTCGKLCHIKDGEYAGTEVEGPEYETVYTFGGLCMIPDIKAIAKINDVCDRLGIDTMSGGNVIALMMEAYETGRLNEEPAVHYGNIKDVLRLVEELTYRRGQGKILSDGIRPAAKALEMEDIAIHIKGLEPAGYDPRGLKGTGLGYAVSTRGGCHLRSVAYHYESVGAVDRFATDGKAEFLIMLEDRVAVIDSAIVCVFARDLFFNWEELCEMYEKVTGLKTTREELRMKSNRMITTARRFNIREGLTRTDDILPKRFLEEPLPRGPSKGSLIKESEMNGMLNDYYALRGWNHEGIPPEAQHNL
jgi:aldehyde:ferredoxin oxidoreductase